MGRPGLARRRVIAGAAGGCAAATARIARAEDASRVEAESVLLGAGAASLVVVGFTLSQAGAAGGRAPDYTDFAYLALTTGMTFQVSDTDLAGLLGQ
jgi:uncharacterized membrane protein